MRERKNLTGLVYVNLTGRFYNKPRIFLEDAKSLGVIVISHK